MAKWREIMERREKGRKRNEGIRWRKRKGEGLTKARWRER